MNSLLPLSLNFLTVKFDAMTIPDNSNNNSGSLSKGVKNALLAILIAVCVFSLARQGFEFGHWLRWH